MPGAGLSRRSPRKAPLGQSAFQPYWGKLAVRNDRGDRGDVGIIRSPVRASILPDQSSCRIGEAGTAPTSTAKSRIDAVPHTVLSTHAGAVFQSLPNASMCAVARGGDDCPTVSVRA